MSVINSLIRYIYLCLTSKILYPINFLGKQITMEDKMTFKIFRHLSVKRENYNNIGSIFIVRFKFSKLNHKANILTSLLPIPLIVGHPGFNDKLWMIDWETGYWQGVYQWDSVENIENYKKSFILKVMNKRSLKDSITYNIIPSTSINDFLDKHKAISIYESIYLKEAVDISL